jgi:lanthanide-dependent methanol dehydrogenase
LHVLALRRFNPPGPPVPASDAAAWTFSTGTDRGHEGAPLVVGDMLDVVTPYPNILYALDLPKPGAPHVWDGVRTPERAP